MSWVSAPALIPFFLKGRVIMGTKEWFDIFTILWLFIVWIWGLVTLGKICYMTRAEVRNMPPEWYGGSDDVSLKPRNTSLGPYYPGVHHKRMKMGGPPMFSKPSLREPGRLPPHTRKEGDTVAPEKPSVIKEKKGEPNLDKAKTRFRAAAWWCFGAVIGLIGGKFFVDFIVYMGMPLRPTGPEKVWAIFMWVALVAVYVCLFGAFWMGLSVIRKKFSLKTSYDMTLGDVRVIKVHPDINDKLLTYEPTDKPQIEMIAEAITIDGEEIP